MHIPAGLAYGALTSLNPVNGIYTSFFTGLTYVLFGTSRHLSVGTYAVISLMVYSTINRVEQKYSIENAMTMTTMNITTSHGLNYRDVNYNFKQKISSSLAFWCGMFQVSVFKNYTPKISYKSEL